MYNEMNIYDNLTWYWHIMNPLSNTLGRFLSELMERQKHNNSTLASVANVSESVIRNLLKHGNDPSAKDPDPRTLKKVADALGIDALLLFRLAGYLSPQGSTHSVRAEFLAELYDLLAPEKQATILGVFEVMSEGLSQRKVISSIRKNLESPLAGFDLHSSHLLRLMANEMIVTCSIRDDGDILKIPQNTKILQYTWHELPQETQERVKGLIRHKLSLDYDPTMVEPEWRK